MHGRQEVFRKGCDGSPDVALQDSLHDRGVFGRDVPGPAGIAPDREPAIAFALLMQPMSGFLADRRQDRP